MIINESEAIKRLDSPMNLMNRLRNIKGSRNSAMSLFIPASRTDKIEDKIETKIEIAATFNPFKNPTLVSIQPSEKLEPTNQTPTLDTILEDHESQVKLGLAHDNALELLNNSVLMLAAKLDDIKADKLPAVVSAAAKTVEGIRKERNESARNGKDKEVHYHFYTPEQKKISDYRIIDVTEHSVLDSASR